MPDDVELIRSRVDIVDLVQEKVQLQKSGKDWRGLCPFHTEKTPSFYVSPSRGRFYCFGCQASGDIFNWVERTENVEFRGALESLAARAGVTLSRSAGPSKNVTDRYIEANESASNFFRDSLTDGSEPRRYLAERGLDQASLERWEIGFAPQDDEALVAHLRKAGIRLEDAAAAGLLRGTGAEGYRPFFQNRIMFPIRDERLRLIAFGGRAMPGDEPKYLNSPETAVFSKGNTLYGLPFAKARLADARQAVIVEGYLDVIACQRAGEECALAPLGTAFRESHVQLLRRWCDKVVLFYDGDPPGISAATKAAALLAAGGIASRVAQVAEGSDPDSLFRTAGGFAVAEAVRDAVSPLRFRLEVLRARAPDLGDDFWTDAKRVLASATDRLERDALIAELAALHPNAKMGIRAATDSLRRDIEALVPRRGAPSRAAVNQEVPVDLDLPTAPERMVLRAALREEFRAEAWPLLSDPGLIVSPAGVAMSRAILAAGGSDHEAGELLLNTDDEIRARFALLEKPSEGLVIEAAFRDAIDRLARNRDLRERRGRLDSGADDAEVSEYFRRLGRT
jgi:DNA primase